MVKNLPVSAGYGGYAGSISGLGRCPVVESGNPLQYLAWRIPWTEKPGGLQSMESQRVGHNLLTKKQQFMHMVYDFDVL